MGVRGRLDEVTLGVPRIGVGGRDDERRGRSSAILFAHTTFFDSLVFFDDSFFSSFVPPGI